MTTPARTPGRTRALLLVLAAVVSVQFGGAIAATLVPQIGAAGSVALRLGIGVVVLWAIARPSLKGHSRRAWVTVVLFGMALGAMNLTFYASLAHLPIGVAVTIEFIGPLTLAAVLSRRGADALAAALAGWVIIAALRTRRLARAHPGEPSFSVLADGRLPAVVAALVGALAVGELLAAVAHLL